MAAHTRPQADLAIPLNSTILVTGATGFIASHVVHEALDLGFTVRGTSRSAEKARESEATHGNHPRYSTVVVSDVSVPGAFREAIVGIDAVIHMATDTSLQGEPEEVIPAVKNATLEVLKAASTESAVKRVVLTSSSSVTGEPKPGVKFHIDRSTWNNESLKAAYETPKSDRAGPAYVYSVYAASKTEAERAAWEYMRDHRPKFTFNTVLPSLNMGTVYPGVNPGPTGSCNIQVYKGELPMFPPQYYVDVRDCARVHLAGLMDKSVDGERLFAFADQFNWNDVRDVIREIWPEAKVMENVEGMPRDETTVDNEPCVELLRKWFGQAGWTSLKDTVRQNLQHLE